mmetsp:Transcript_23924/g.35927  ORF Transcript_23924/g.35927 Transcript_23924/m.35927 type:complete len:114 (-) Transcript_23924:944-1285(-)
MPFIAQVCVGGREKLSVFGDDYESPNGTGVRDHIHVEDLVTGHGAAVNKLYSDSCVGCETVNLGTGNGASVLDLVSKTKLCNYFMAGQREKVNLYLYTYAMNDFLIYSSFPIE